MPLFTKPDFDCFSCRTGYNSRTSHPPSILGIFTAHKMTATASLPPDLTSSGDFDSFAQTFVGFLFRHLIDSLNIKDSNLRHLQLLVNTTAWKFSKKTRNQHTILLAESPILYQGPPLS